MYISTSQKRIGSAVLLGAAVIAVSLYLRQTNDQKNALTNDTASGIVVTEAPKRSAINIADSNNDGVPDWQEALVATTPLAGDVLGASSTVPYNPPDTLTERFSRQFFENMLRTKTAGDFGGDSESLVKAATQSLAADAVDTPFTNKDIIVKSDNQPVTLSAYGEAVAEILQNKKDTTGENEAAILNRAISTEDPEELKKLDVKIDIYKAIIAETKSLAVPTLVAQQHLNLLNTYQAILNDIIAMRGAFSDPMRALLRIKRYEDDTKGLLAALENLYTTLNNNGAQWETGSAVGAIINLEQ